MEFRIRDFNDVYRERLLARLFAIGPDQDPDDRRAMLAEVLPPPPPPLARQTNRHHLLPPAKLEQWWAATTAEERNELMAEYDAAEAAAEQARAMREAAEEMFQAQRDAGFTGSFTVDGVDSCMTVLEWEARQEAADAAEDAAWTVTWPTADQDDEPENNAYELPDDEPENNADDLPEDDEERDAGTTVYQDDAGPLDYDDDDEVYDTLLLE